MPVLVANNITNNREETTFTMVTVSTWCLVLVSLAKMEALLFYLAVILKITITSLAGFDGATGVSPQLNFHFLN